MARGGKKGHTPHTPSRPHAGDRRLAGLVRRSVRPGEVPTMGGAASIGRGSGGGGGGKAPKGISLREFIKSNVARRFPTGRSSTPRERGLGLRSEVKRTKARNKTREAVLRSDERLFRHSSGEKRMSPAQLRREGRFRRNLAGRLEEINPIRPVIRRVK